MIKRFFSDVSQTFFIENHKLGFAWIVVCLALEPYKTSFGLISSIIALVSMKFIRRTLRITCEKNAVAINSFFFGVAFAYFFSINANLIFFFVLISLSVPFFCAAIEKFFVQFKLPTLVTPFLVSFSFLWLVKNSSSLFPLNQFSFQDELRQPLAWFFTHAVLTAYSQVVFSSNLFLGAAIIGLLLFFQPAKALSSLLIVLITTLITYAAGFPALAIYNGFYGCSAFLLGLALSDSKFSTVNILKMIFASIVLSIAIVPTYYLFEKVGLLALTAPFVLVKCLFVLSETIQKSESISKPKQLINF